MTEVTQNMRDMLRALEHAMTLATARSASVA